MGQYDTPRIPPSTPPVIAPEVDEAEAAQAPVDGDAAKSGSAVSDHSPKAAGEANDGIDARSREMIRRDKRDGLGEQGMDAQAPDQD